MTLYYILAAVFFLTGIVTAQLNLFRAMSKPDITYTERMKYSKRYQVGFLLIVLAAIIVVCIFVKLRHP